MACMHVIRKNSKIYVPEKFVQVQWVCQYALFCF